MVTWGDIASEMLREVKDVPHADVRSAAQRSAIMSLKDSRVWRAAMTPVPLSAGQHVYSWNTPSDEAEVVAGVDLQLLIRPRSGGSTTSRPLIPVQRADALAGRHSPTIPNAWPDGAATQQGTPIVWMEWQDGAGERSFAVAPTPNREHRYAVRGEVALVPTASATRLPSDVYGHARELIRCGILWDLYSQFAQPWGARTRSDHWRTEYLSRKNDLLNSRGLAVKSRRFVRAGRW